MLSGVSPLPHLDLRGSDRAHSALALRSGLITNLILETGLGQKCGRGLAPDSGNEVMHVLADTLLSGASLNWSTNFGHQLRFHAASFSIATGDR